MRLVDKEERDIDLIEEYFQEALTESKFEQNKKKSRVKERERASEMNAKRDTITING